VLQHTNLLEEAQTLLDNPQTIARRFTSQLVQRIDKAIARNTAPISPREMAPSAQLELAAAIALHDGAFELHLSRDPAGSALVTEGLERVRAALGEKDLLATQALLARL